MNPDYPAILNSIRPGTQWAIGETYESMIWLDDSPKPTKKTLDDAWPQVQSQLEHDRIEAQRRARYQAETDGLYFAAMREDTPTLAAWIAAVDKIKADLPYPEAPSA
jgi:DNA-binding transcriptional regulator YbjK